MIESVLTHLAQLSTTEDTNDTDVLGVLRGGELKHPSHRPAYLLL